MMKLKVRKHTAERKANRLKKKIRIRKTVKGTDERPRLVVYRSSGHMYAQIVNDTTGFIYHGRVKALADGAREGGLNF